MKHIVIDLEMNKIARSSEARKICKSEIIERSEPSCWMKTCRRSGTSVHM